MSNSMQYKKVCRLLDAIEPYVAQIVVRLLPDEDGDYIVSLHFNTKEQQDAFARMLAECTHLCFIDLLNEPVVQMFLDRERVAKLLNRNSHILVD